MTCKNLEFTFDCDSLSIEEKVAVGVPVTTVEVSGSNGLLGQVSLL